MGGRAWGAAVGSAPMTTVRAAPCRPPPVPGGRAVGGGRGRGREPQPQSSACRHARLDSSTAAGATGARSSQPQTAAASCGSALVRVDSKVVAFTPLDSSHHLLLRCCLSSNHQPAIDPTACIPPAASKTPDGTPAPAARQPHDQCQPRAGRRERGRRHSEARDHAFFGQKNVRYLSSYA